MLKSYKVDMATAPSVTVTESTVDVKAIAAYATSVVEGTLKASVAIPQLGPNARLEVGVAVSKEVDKNNLDNIATTASNMKQALQSLANELANIVSARVANLQNYIAQMAQQGVGVYVFEARIQDMFVNDIEAQLAQKIQSNQYLSGARYHVAAVLYGVQPQIADAETCTTAQPPAQSGQQPTTA